MTAKLGTLSAGTRVRDRFARTGVVVRETFAEPVGNPVHRHLPPAWHLGVMWDGTDFVVEYPAEKAFDVIEPPPPKPV